MVKKIDLMKVDPTFKQMLEELRMKRIRNGLDKEVQSFRTLTRKITRYPPLWETLEKAKFVDDERGQFTVFNIFTFMIIGFVAVLFFAGLIYVSGLLNTTFHQAGLLNEANSGQPGYANLTQAADVTFGQMNNGVQSLRLVAITLIFSLILGTIITNAMVRIHPAFFIVYIFIVVLAIIFSATISNAYESILRTNVYDGLLQSFTGSGWILLHLPLVTALTGVLGGIFLFINIVRTGAEGGLQ